MESPAAGIQRSRPRSQRRPLQPKNSPADPHRGSNQKPKRTPRPVQILPMKGDLDKENRPPFSGSATVGADVGPKDLSLAEELGAIRQRMERLRSEKERTEKLLRDMDLVLEKEMREMEGRGKEQHKLESEVKRLIRLKQLRSSCTRSSPFQSLRQKEQEKRSSDAQPQGIECEAKETTMKQSLDAEPSGSGEVGTRSPVEKEETPGEISE